MESNWFCSSDCSSMGTSSPLTGSLSLTAPAPPCSNCTQCDNSLLDLKNHMDAQFGILKDMIVEVKKSQEFIGQEFDNMKTELKNIVAESLMLNKKCETLENINQRQDIRIQNLEYKFDTLQQRELNSHIILVGLPDKHRDPVNVVQSLFKTLQCEVEFNNVASCTYMLAVNNQIHNGNIPDNKIIIKFLNPSAKIKVCQQKKKIKPTLTAVDIGFDQNKQLYFRHNLTPLRRILFREAREFKKNNNYKYLWINDGQILLRKADGTKITRVETKADLIRITGTNST